MTNPITWYIEKWKREFQKLSPASWQCVSFVIPLIATAAMPLAIEGVKYAKKEIDKRRKKKK